MASNSRISRLGRIRSIFITISCFTVLGLFAAPYIFALVWLGPKKCWRWRQAYGRALIRATFCRLEILGQPPGPEEVCVYVGNHQSMFDAPMVAAAINGDFSVIAKKELLKVPIFGSIVKRMGFMFIDRENRKDSSRSIQLSIDKIRSGTSVLIFPEGTRTRTGRMGIFRPGAYIIAKETGVPIAPFRISGSYEANPRGWDFYPGWLTIEFGEPLRPADYAKLSTAELSDLARERITLIGERKPRISIIDQHKEKIIVSK